METENKKNNVYLSVIIPTFNSAKTIVRCLKSVLNQNFQNFEVLVVDDGSTDETRKLVLDFYDERLKYYKIKHQGVAQARNFGLKKAKGKYITFIDSDDYIENNYFKNFNVIAKYFKQDIYLCGINLVSSKTVLVRNANLDGQFNKIELFNNYKDNVFNSGVFCLVTNKIYKHEIIKKHKIKFNKNFSIGEDLNFNLKIFRYSVLFYFDSNFYYNHVERSQSLTFKYHKDYLKISYLNIKLLTKIFKKILSLNDLKLNEYKQYILDYTINNYKNCQYDIKLYNKIKKYINIED